jgi:DDE_Tnp_1-associated
MPAARSSLTDPAIGQLLTAAQALSGQRARLLPVLAAVPDPRARRGVRHRLAVILGLALCAVLAGARSFTAIAEWAADADQATREALGVTGVVPCESTFRRTLRHLDADALDDAAGGRAQQRTTPAPGARRAVAVDGKTLRGSGLARPAELAAIARGHWLIEDQLHWARRHLRRGPLPGPHRQRPPRDGQQISLFGVRTKTSSGGCTLTAA